MLKQPSSVSFSTSCAMPMKVSFSLTSMWKRLFSVCDAVFFHTLHRDTQILRFHSDTRLGAIYYNRILLVRNVHIETAVQCLRFSLLSQVCALICHEDYFTANPQEQAQGAALLAASCMQIDKFGAGDNFHI